MYKEPQPKMLCAADGPTGYGSNVSPQLGPLHQVPLHWVALGCVKSNFPLKQT